MANEANPPRDDEQPPRTLEDILASGGIRGEVPGCPTGLARAMRVPKKDKDKPADQPPATGEERPKG